MKKIFAMIFAAMFLLTGCGGNSTSKTEPSAQKQTEQPAPEPPKELTPEEKAAKEAEEKALEEKRLAEQKAAEEKKAQEEARKQAERQAAEEKRRQEQAEREIKQREQALAKTLRVTPYEFVQRFNDSAYAFGIGGIFDIGEPQIQNGSVQDATRYIFNDNLAMIEAISKENGNIKELTVLVSPSQDVDKFRLDLMSAVAIYATAIKATNSDLTLDDVAIIQDRLGMSKNIAEWVNDSSTNYNNRRYVKQVIKGIGISFIITTP